MHGEDEPLFIHNEARIISMQSFCHFQYALQEAKYCSVRRGYPCLNKSTKLISLRLIFKYFFFVAMCLPMHEVVRSRPETLFLFKELVTDIRCWKWLRRWHVAGDAVWRRERRSTVLQSVYLEEAFFELKCGDGRLEPNNLCSSEEIPSFLHIPIFE
jgi:hypothetical protein